MRWKKAPKAEEHSLRKIRKFLVFPKTIGLETRWLEYARLTQIYYYGYGWVDYRWE